jgi:polyisoprenoid-binding protein YceI
MNTLASSRSARRLTAALAAAVLASSTVAFAAPQSFDFKDPTGVNNVQFKLDAPLESITGTGTGISGNVSFDPAAPEAISGRIVLDAASLTVGNPIMGEHLRSADWLDVAKYPVISFEVGRIANVRTQGAQILADVTGMLIVKGVAKEVTVPVAFTHLPDKLGARLGDAKIQGDLLVLRANFEINRSDFSIMAGQATDKVAENIQLSLSIAGAAARQ